MKKEIRCRVKVFQLSKNSHFDAADVSVVTFGPLKDWFISGDYARERNERIDLRAWGGRAQLGYLFSALRWNPRITLTHKSFSGDAPTTPALERFDPLYWDGSPSTWSSGSKSSMVFVNSNVQSTELAFGFTPSSTEALTLRISHLRANELASPLQFGQATRVVMVGDSANLVSGVTGAHLSDGVFLEYSRALNTVTFLTAGMSAAFPGKGIDNVTGGGAPVWTGGFVNVVINF